MEKTDLEKPSDCYYRQAGVEYLQDRGISIRVKVGLAILVTFCVFSAICNIVLFLWLREVANAMITNDRHFQLEISNLKTSIAKYPQLRKDDEDYEDNNDDLASNGNDTDSDSQPIVRILRAGKKRGNKKEKSKGKKNIRKKRNRRGHGRCSCEKDLKKLIQKREVSNISPGTKPVTHLKGISRTNTQLDPTDNEGVFKWQTPGWQYPLLLQYGYESDAFVTSIQVPSAGLYKVYSQVALGGSASRDSGVAMAECGQNLIRSSNGVNTTLARSLVTQGHSNQYGTSTPNVPIDTTFLTGIFPLEAGDRVFVRKSCSHSKFVVNELLSYFGVSWYDSSSSR